MAESNTPDPVELRRKAVLHFYVLMGVVVFAAMLIATRKNARAQDTPESPTESITVPSTSTPSRVASTGVSLEVKPIQVHDVRDLVKAGISTAELQTAVTTFSAGEWGPGRFGTVTSAGGFLSVRNYDDAAHDTAWLLDAIQKVTADGKTQSSVLSGTTIQNVSFVLENGISAEELPAFLAETVGISDHASCMMVTKSGILLTRLSSEEQGAVSDVVDQLRAIVK